MQTNISVTEVYNTTFNNATTIRTTVNYISFKPTNFEWILYPIFFLFTAWIIVSNSVIVGAVGYFEYLRTTTFMSIASLAVTDLFAGVFMIFFLT